MPRRLVAQMKKPDVKTTVATMNNDEFVKEIFVAPISSGMNSLILNWLIGSFATFISSKTAG
jgi:hypothetical protein